MDNVYGKKAEQSHIGITKKGKGQLFVCANVVLKANLTKGNMLKDKKGRYIRIINVFDDGAIEVEVKTLSKHKDEKKGQVRLKMYRPNKKGCSIQVTRSSVFGIVFVKTIVEKFLQPIIDSIINDSEKDPLKGYTTNPPVKPCMKKVILKIRSKIKLDRVAPLMTDSPPTSPPFPNFNFNFV